MEGHNIKRNMVIFVFIKSENKTMVLRMMMLKMMIMILIMIKIKIVIIGFIPIMINNVIGTLLAYWVCLLIY